MIILAAYYFCHFISRWAPACLFLLKILAVLLPQLQQLQPDFNATYNVVVPDLFLFGNDLDVWKTGQVLLKLR